MTRSLMLVAVLCFTAATVAAQGTLMQLPTQSGTFSNSVRGYWFTAPTDFTIVGLRVPTDASTGPQSIQVLKLTTPPAIYSATSTNFTNLHYTASDPSLNAIPVNIQINQGDFIGILGYRGAINSYGAGQYSTMIGTFPVTLIRLLYQGPINVTPAPNVSEETNGSISRVEMYYDIGPSLATTANAGTAKPVLSNEQGAGNIGVEAGSFTIGSNAQPGCIMTGIDLKASGSGDDSTAFTEVSIYRDDPTGANPGTYDSGDVLVSGPDNFTADDGTISFNVATAEQPFPINETRTYFVVAKLAGTALPGNTFEFTVEDLVVATGTGKSGVPSTIMAGLVVDSPEFVFTDDSPNNPQKVFLTFSGVCQEFTINYPAGPDDKPGTISVNALGTADESTDLVGVQLWWDSDNDMSFNSTLDTLVDTQVYATDNGGVAFDFASHPNFQAGQTRRFFIVYVLNANADDQETFRCYIADMGPASLGGTATGLPAPSTNGTLGLEVSAAILFGIMNGPVAPLTVDSNSDGATGDGELLADVTLEALPGGDWVINSMVFNAGGTGNHNAAYSELALYEDDGSTTWDGASVDTLAAPMLSGFSANVASFDLINTTQLAGTERRFFLVGKLNGTAATGETFNARLTDVLNLPPIGGSLSGFPTPASTALIIDVPALSVANSPNQPDPATHAAGAAGDLVAASFRFNALNGATTVTGLVMTTGGTGNWSTDIDAASGVQVYLDDGDGVYGSSDTLLYQGAGAATVTATFTHSLATGEVADLWVVLGLTASAGQGVAATPETFNLAIAAASDVNASAPVEFGMPAPNGATVGAIEFNVAGFAPESGPTAGGSPITITGSGFMAPFSVTIGGTVCPGTAVIAGGTQVTGLTVPPGAGVDLPIVVHSGDLPAQTLAITFDYVAPKDTPAPKPDESSCSTGTSSGLAVLLGLLSLAAGIVVLRRYA